MLSWKRTIVIAFTFGFILGWMGSKGQARSPLSPQELVQALRRRFEELTDYQCQMINTRYKNGRAIVESENYFFKKPKLIRLEVTSGKDKGSIAVLTRRGKVRARAGGILGLFTITMEPNDKRLQDEDGSTFVESHLGGTIKDIESALAGASATVTEIERGRRLYQLQIDREGKRDLILVDAELMLPIEWQSLRAGQLDSKTEWRDLRVDVGLKDSLFEL